ncbi:unnamed protein product [Rhizophagus irregularis]|nr:unnamed protein product [Rhizophagus irregularis]
MHPSYNKWKRLLSQEKAFYEFDSTFIPSNSPSNSYLTQYSWLKTFSDHLLSSSLLSRSEKKTFWHILVKRSIFVNPFSICTGSSGNSLSSKFTPSAAVSFTYGSDSEIDEFLFSGYPFQSSPIDYNRTFTQAHPPHLFNYDEVDDGLLAYVPSESASVSQLMSDARLPLANATRLVAAKLPALYTHARARYASPIITLPQQVESFIDFNELLMVYNAPLQCVESFIDFDELLSVYDVSLLPRNFDVFTLIDNSDDELYDFDDDLQFSFSSFDDSPFLCPLSDPIVPLQIVFPLFCFNLCPLMAVSTILFSDKNSDYNSFSIGPFFDSSKFERHRKWKIYRSSLSPVMIFVS